MEKEILGILELLKQGLKELPSFGSEAWATITKGYAVEHFIYGFITIVFGIVVMIATILILKYMTKNEGYHSYDLSYVAIIGGLAFILLVFISGYNLARGLAPDYFIIKSVLNIQ